MTDKETGFDEFVAGWTDDEAGMKKALLRFRNRLEAIKGVSFDFKARPGVSYSLRARHENQKDRTLFVMIDVVDDDPEARWISMCFYGDLITDPDEMGDLVPGGLLGEDGHCFDFSEWSDEMAEYLEARLSEAATNSAG